MLLGEQYTVCSPNECVCLLGQTQFNHPLKQIYVRLCFEKKKEHKSPLTKKTWNLLMIKRTIAQFSTR